MKAIVLKEAGGVGNLQITEVDQPAIQPNQVLVKVKVFGINPVDIKTRSGKALYNQLKENQPLILGWDISGEVVAIGNGVKKFKVGDQVFGMVNFPGHGKAYAEYVSSPEAHLALKPATISHQEAAAATLAALTAWQVLVHQMNLQAGQRLLLHAAAGGVGHFAAQIAKHLGAYVIGTASAKNADFLKQLGIDEHIDYTNQDFATVAKDIDAVFDPMGGDVTRKSLQVLKEGGKIVSIVGGVKEDIISLAQERRIDASNYLVQSSGEDMEKLAALLTQGVLKSHVSQEFAFDTIADAHLQIETGKTKGKLVVLAD